MLDPHAVWMSSRRYGICGGVDFIAAVQTLGGSATAVVLDVVSTRSWRADPYILAPPSVSYAGAL